MMKGTSDHRWGCRAIVAGVAELVIKRRFRDAYERRTFSCVPNYIFALV